MARISRLNEKLSASETGLILFDTLNGFLHPKDNPAKVQFLAERNALANLRKLKDGARAAGITSFYPMGQHAADGSDAVDRLTDTDVELSPASDGKSVVFRPMLAKGTWETEIAEEVRPDPSDVLVPKNRWGSFYQTNLELQLRVRGITTIIIAGGSTDVGIASTLYAARDMDLGIVVVSDCCYSTRGNNHEFFMERVFPRMGRVMTVDETVALMCP